jgi:iron complex transport system substrate-binding protein
MHNKTFSSTLYYILSITTILGWWYFAFLFPPSSKNFNTLTPLEIKTPKTTPPPFLAYLSPLKRERIQEALAGDIKIMTSLISDWDVDARILEKHGLFDVKRLSREKFLKAQMIGRKLLNSNDQELRELRHQFAQKTIVDDTGNLFVLDSTFQKFLPQSFFAASILLAITPPENIVAIPHGFRYQKDLYPIATTEKIPLDIDRYNSEKIYQMKPEIAFVAHYSHPSTLQALKNQGIQLFTIKSIDSFPEITSTINRIGQVVNRALEAELLTLFMESAMLAIDNHLYAMSHSALEEQGSPRVMFLNHLTQFSIPTSKTITGQLIEKLHARNFNFISMNSNDKNRWMTPVDLEQLQNLNPDCLIVSTSDSEFMMKKFSDDPVLRSLAATKNNKLFFIDAAPQAPTQYLVIAYLDIAEALVKATSPSMR